MIRGMVVRLVEWRARSFTDPAERLQFLQRRLGHSSASRSAWRALTRMPILTTLGLALAGIGLVPACRRALGLVLPFVLASAPATPKMIQTPPPNVARSPAPAALSHVWQVEANHQFDLALDNPFGPLQLLVIGMGDLQYLDGIANGRQGVAQLVGEHGQKLIFVSVAFLNVPVEPSVVDGDGGAAHHILRKGKVIRRERSPGGSDGQSHNAESPPARS